MRRLLLLAVRAGHPLGTELADDSMKFARRAGVIFVFVLWYARPGLASIYFPQRGPTVPGKTAELRHGIACAPEQAPLAVKRAIWAANQLRKRPYRYGGGHHSFWDNGYDCSGTVSFALAAAGLIRLPMSSEELAHYGARGRGKWITVYARDGHAYAIIAGLRLDTTAWNDRDPDAPRWRIDGRPPEDFARRHPPGF